MANQWPIRASDQDRERVAGVLGDAYAAGCLDKDELEHRSGLAYSARTLNDLQALIADLPAWLLERPVPLPHECGHGRPPRRSVLDWPAGLLLAVAGFWLIVLAVAWMPLLAAPGIAAWLLLTMRARHCRRYQHRLSTRSGNDRNNHYLPDNRDEKSKVHSRRFLRLLGPHKGAPGPARRKPADT